MSYRVGVVTGTRAEYGILKPLIQKISDNQNMELCLLVTGMHLEEKYGNTYQEIERDGFPISYKIPMDLNSDEEKAILDSMAKELQQFGKVLGEAKLDLMVVLGDRFEILVAVTAAMVCRVPVAHLHGGESTEGNIDESIRHAITKMSQYHFPATSEYAKRIIQMGEDPSHVFNVGALGVENVKKCKLLDREALQERFGQQFGGDYIMVTYHPVTLEDHSARRQFENLLEVIQSHSEYNYIFTYANADPDGAVINQLIDSFSEENDNVIAFKSMGQIGYLSALRFASFVMGNSSSGLIEVPSFGIPTINIGDRQTGRMKADSVIDCGYEVSEIEEAFQKALSPFHEKCKTVKNPYEGENTSEQIIQKLEEILTQGTKLKKHFNDI